MTKKNKDYGEPIAYDQTFSGPVAVRAVTDLFCCIVFIIAMFGYLMLGVAALLIGNPQYTVHEQSSTGEFCGIGLNVDKPHMFYFDVTKCASAVRITSATFKGLLCPTTQVCVKQCPLAFWFLPPEAFTAGAKPHDIFQQELCDPSLDLAQTTLTVQEILDKELCPTYHTPSKRFQGKCLPSFNPNHVPSDFIVPGSTSTNKTIKSIMDATRFLRSGFNGKSMKVRIIEDLVVSGYWILIGLVIALVISMLLLLLMRCCVSGVVILLIVGVLSMGAYGIYLCFQEYQISMYSKLTPGDLRFKLSNQLQVKKVWLACLVILSLLELLLLMLCVSCLRKGFVTALAIMGECSKAVGVIWSTMVYPVVTFLLVTLCMTFTTVSSVNLATSGLPGYNIVPLNRSTSYCKAIRSKLKCDPKTFKASDYPNCPVRCVFLYNDDDNDGFFVQFLHSYNLLMCLFCLHFIITLGQCTLARTFSTYYWSLSRLENIDPCTLFKAFFQMLRYHTGSMAYGAVFVTMFHGIRIVLDYLEDVSKGGQKCCCCCNPLKMLLKICFCASNKVHKYFNRNTYIMIAVYGENYFAAAKNAYMLRGRNKDRVLVVVDRVTDLLLFFGTLLVAGTVGGLAFCFFSGDIFQAEFLNYRWLPCIILIVGAYFIAQGCFSVYSMGVDTFTLCVMEDLERNNGTMQRPYMSRSIMHILRRQSDSV